MSNTQFAFINKQDVPTQQQWQQAIDALNMPVSIGIDASLVPFEDEGFLPCQWADTDDDVGFEIYYEPSSNVTDEDDELKAIAQDKDYCISLCWGAEMKDCAAVMIASCALMQYFGAIISYEGDEPLSIEELIAGAYETISAG